MSIKYFIHNGQTQNGPYTIEELKLMKLDSSAYVWHDKLSEWTSIGSVPELKDLLISKPPVFSKAPPPNFKQPSQYRNPHLQKEEVKNNSDYTNPSLFRWIMASLIDLIPLFLILVFFQIYEYKQYAGDYDIPFQNIVINVLGFQILLFFDMLYNGIGIVLYPILLLIYGLYFAVMDSKYGGTIGKRIMKIRLVTTDNTPPTFGMVYRRFLLILFFFAIIALIQILLRDYVFKIYDDDTSRIKGAIIDKISAIIILSIIILKNKNQCFHDKIIGTMKIKK